MTTFLALLRAVNVGGHQQVGMTDLRELLTHLGFADGRSVLQSSNLIFRTRGRTATQLERLLESESRKRLDLHTAFFVRSGEEWDAIIAHNP